MQTLAKIGSTLSRSVVVSILAAVALSLGALDRGHAQSRSGSAPSQTAPSAAPPAGPGHSPAQRTPQRGGASDPAGTGVPWHAGRDDSDPPGTDVPEWAYDGSVGTSGRSVGGSPRANSGPNSPNDPDRVPIGGIGWLLTAALGYGTYRLRGKGASSVT
jgi:hypothetical protein